MCCWTHDERDRFDSQRGVEFTIAGNEHLRCQCQYGAPCQREQVAGPGPLLLCQWCRSENHISWCDRFSRIPLGDNHERVKEMIRQRMAQTWGP
jgi:hypothetical protein